MWSHRNSPRREEAQDFRTPDEEENDPESVNLGQSEFCTTSEALWFAPGGQYEEDDAWDVFAEDSEEESLPVAHPQSTAPRLYGGQVCPAETRQQEIAMCTFDEERFKDDEETVVVTVVPAQEDVKPFEEDYEGMSPSMARPQIVTPEHYEAAETRREERIVCPTEDGALESFRDDYEGMNFSRAHPTQYEDQFGLADTWQQGGKRSTHPPELHGESAAEYSPIRFMDEGPREKELESDMPEREKCENEEDPLLIENSPRDKVPVTRVQKSESQHFPSLAHDDVIYDKKGYDVQINDDKVSDHHIYDGEAQDERFSVSSISDRNFLRHSSSCPEPPLRSTAHKRKNVTDLCPDDFALLGALPRQLPKMKARLQELDSELRQLRIQMMEVNKAVIGVHLKSRPISDRTDGRSDTEDGSHQFVNRVTAADTEAIENRRSEIEKEFNPLKADTESKESAYDELLMMVGNHPKVKKARKSYIKERSKFIDQMFISIKRGNLEKLAILTAALHLENWRDDLITLVHPQSHLSIIHLALMVNKQDIVKFLLQFRGKDIAKISVKTKECDKMTPLYIALQQGSFENVKLLLESLPTDERAGYINQLVSNRAYEGKPYNELPLAGSIWSSAGKDSEDMIHLLNYLVENGANLELKTSDGNTLLHLLVYQAVECIEHLSYFRDFLKQAFSEAVGKWWIQKENSQGFGRKKLSTSDAEALGLKYLLNLRNKDKLTPVALAAKVESPLYVDLVNWENVTRYPDLKMDRHFSDVDTYDITNITSLRTTSKGYEYDQSSVMHVLAHNNVNLSQKVWNVDMSCLEPLKTVIKQKWRVYQWFYYLWGIVHVIHMIAFTITTFDDEGKTGKMQENVALPAFANGSGNANGSSSSAQEQASDDIRPVHPGNPFFAFFLLLPTVYLICEIIDFLFTGDYFELRYSLTGNMIYRLLSVFFSLLTYVWFILHMLENVNQDIILSIVLLFGWHFCIFFTRTLHFPSKSSQIGAFSIMVQRMLFYDLIPFILISFFVLLAFSTALHATLLQSEAASEKEITFGVTFFDMLAFYAALDGGSVQEYSREEKFAKALMSTYGIISVVLLINMLIAAMNKTYDMVRSTHTDLVVRQRLSILLLLERRLPFQWLRKKSESAFLWKFNQYFRENEAFVKVSSAVVIGKHMKIKHKNKKHEKN